ncbi:hypothetical protein RB595_006862 [Gaeumannomyces hyphopodioides]
MSLSSSPAPLASAPEWLPWAAAAAVTYHLLVRALRHLRARRTQARYPYGPGQKLPYSAMTDRDAQELVVLVQQYEFPSVAELGLQSALVRTYGIPSISALLLRTRQLSTRAQVARRYADTTALVGEIYTNEAGSRRLAESYARLNYLHSVYIKAGRITNDDMLYVLALFMNQPADHIDRLDWRPLSDLERCAYGAFHRTMAESMDIDLSPLPSAGAGAGWRDGLHFYRELDGWARAYEERNMVPHDENLAVAAHTRELYLRDFPPFLRGLGANLLAASMDDRFRTAVKFDRPSSAHYTIVAAVFAAKRLVCRHLLPPRQTPYCYYARPASRGDVRPDGTRGFVTWTGSPYYVRPTLWNRWGPYAWLAWSLGVPLPGDEGMMPEGYTLKDVGPDQFRGKGWDEAEGTARDLMEARSAGRCPFA